jgi:RNA polymerase subunit RPABC4/transcription elongation factor Spt4
MFCTNCGEKIEEGVKFCSGCGKAVTGVSNEPITPIIQQQPTVLQTQAPMADEKYCFSCGSVIKRAAEICPKCGVNQSKRSNTTAIDVYCTSCGKTIRKEASTCPFCGVAQEGSATKNKTTALLLCLFTAVGHRFYVGKIGTAILMTLVYLFFILFALLVQETGDEIIAVFFFIFFLGYLIWWIIDLVMIGNGKFRDKQDNPLKKS